MILSVSRRTDIPAFFPRWFIQRLREGYVLVRNPMNLYQVSRINLTPELIDCIVFWTKNPKPMLPFLNEISSQYPFYFQYTLNAYGKDVEPKLPDISEKIRTFRELSNQVGKERVIWRYDPILISTKYTVKWHIMKFKTLVNQLAPYVESCVLSFFDDYAKISKKILKIQGRECGEKEMHQLAEAFSSVCKEHNIQLKTCAEQIDLEQYGILHNKCIDPALIERITGYEVPANKDKNQRMECGCVESIDIGQYNTCLHGCRYCYANFNDHCVKIFMAKHKDDSPFLTGESEPGDKITIRKIKSFRVKEGNVEQLSLL